jgi:uncharacterized membrane protein
VTDAAPTDQLKNVLGQLVSTLASRAVSTVTNKVGESAHRLTEFAEGGGSGGLGAALTGVGKLAEGKNPARAALSAGMSGIGGKVKQALGGGGGNSGDSAGASGKGGDLKLTNIVESIDVGVPVDVAYDQWTRFTDFPSFMKKVEGVDQESDEQLTWKAQVLWSHRTWESTILDQKRNEHIVWRSKGAKGYVDGAVTFHELAPRLTRILLVLEYHPQGFFEQTGNLWRAQGRRARLELKHFRRHVMTSTLLQPEEVEGWHGRIRDGEVVEDSDEDEESRDQQDGADDSEYDDSDEDDYQNDEEEDYDEDYDEYGDDEDEDEDEYGDDTGGAEDEQEQPRRRRPAATRGGR